MSDNEKIQTKEKMPKPIEKFIWLGASVVIALVGYFLRTGGVKLPFWGSVAFTVALLFTIIIAAQKVSTERFALAENKETKKQYILKTILYYIYIFIAVFYIFLSLWVSRILSV
ncbi:MAG: hypothetical protein IKT61_03990 [Clostridia bacterium]|nr:hypothetical protein [Clostridia bacterium]